MKLVVPCLSFLLLPVPALAQTGGSSPVYRRAMGWLDAPRDLAAELGLGLHRIQAFADVDGDGRTDLLAFREDPAPIVPILNTGLDEYELGTPFGTSESRYVRLLADITGDGLPDLVTDDETSSGLLVHVNEGGTFAPFFHIDTVGQRPLLGTVGEMDGDPGLEVAEVYEDLVSHDHFVRWWNWNGSTLVPSADTLVGPVASSVATGDLNADGRDDVIVGTMDTEQVLVFETAIDGSPALVQTLDVDTSGGTTTLDPIFVLAGDLDGDGDVDGVAIWYNGGGDTAIQVSRNDGTPPLVLEPVQIIDVFTSFPARVFLADWDEDGDPDLFATGQYISIFENTGDRTFQLSARIPTPSLPDAAGVTDLNGDGFLDFVGNVVKSGNGRFEDLFAELPASFDFGRAIDIDGDQDLDVVSRIRQVFENDGSGHFELGLIEDRFDPPPPTVNFQVRALGDFDGDGELDFLAGIHGPNSFSMALARGTGDGHFQYAGAAAAPNVVVGSDLLIDRPPVDLDGDGDLDVLGEEGWAENDGNGYFTVDAAWDGRSPTAGDVDLDGDADVALHTSPTATLYRNDGAGTFQASLLSDISAGEMHFVDFDRDGLPEFVTNAFPGTNQIRLFENRGGYFPGPPMVFATPSFSNDFLAFDDFDGDGRLDMLGTRPRFESAGGEATLIWRQLPGPSLAFASPRHYFTAVRPVVRGDFDGDGDLDLLHRRMIRGWRHNPGHEGKVRRVPDAPLDGGAVQPLLDAHGSLEGGSPLTFTVTGAPGPGRVVLAGPDRGRIASWRVGPGSSSRTVRIPPGLDGVLLHASAFFLDPAAPRGLRASNALEITLARTMP